MKCSPRSVQCRERKQSGSLWKTVPISSDGCALAVVLLLYAGCLCHLMQAVNCETDWRRQTVFTYNDSYYGQHRNPPLQGPYQLQAQSYLYINHRNTFVQPRRERVYNYDTRINEVDYYGHGEEETDIEDQPLLVGYSHNPYGNSVKRSEYSRDSPPERAEETSVQLSSGNESRGKRGVIHLYNMISCATGCDPITYKGYGCYCGFLGSGRALDGIDRCCKTHDHCYEDLFCPFFTVYFQPYFWKCHRNQPLCALENYNTRNQFINGCAAKLCECDRQFAMCLQRYPCPRRRAVCRSSPLRLLQNLIMAR